MLGVVVYKAKKDQIDLSASPEQVASLYERFPSDEQVERAFSYLFAKTGDRDKATVSYKKHIRLLELRDAYGMAGDVAAEAGEMLESNIVFQVRAEELYLQQIQKMDKERFRDGEMNESYYIEMLLKAGELDRYRQRTELHLKYMLGRGEFGAAAHICDQLRRTEEAGRYRKLDEMLKLD